MPRASRAKVVKSSTSTTSDGSNGITWATSVIRSLQKQRSVVQSLLDSKKAVGTPFQTEVWAVCSLVPKGKVASYGAVAFAITAAKFVTDNDMTVEAAIAKTKACGIGSLARGVGQALRRNPVAPAVPCHRVVDSKGDLHGFSGSTTCESLGKKAKLLVSEGVSLSPDGSHVSPSDLIKV